MLEFLLSPPEEYLVAEYVILALSAMFGACYLLGEKQLRLLALCVSCLGVYFIMFMSGVVAIIIDYLMIIAL